MTPKQREMKSLNSGERDPEKRVITRVMSDAMLKYVLKSCNSSYSSRLRGLPPEKHMHYRFLKGLELEYKGVPACVSYWTLVLFLQGRFDDPEKFDEEGHNVGGSQCFGQ